jgi:hypothetical protein
MSIVFDGFLSFRRKLAHARSTRWFRHLHQGQASVAASTLDGPLPSHRALFLQPAKIAVVRIFFTTLTIV